MKSEIKEKVKEYYGGIAKKVDKSTKGSCCGSGSSCCGDITNAVSNYDFKSLALLPIEAVNASLGCSNPIVIADLKEGETVLDLGSGGGIDVLLASRYVGASGKVYGLDMTDEMLNLANKNKEKMGVKNVDFIKGYIEDIPLNDESVDVIMSNCVINLSEDKDKALAEACRVLKKGGRLAISDIVTLKDVPREIRMMAEAWVGCIAGTVKISEYTSMLEKAGFKNISIEPVNVYDRKFIESILNGREELLSKVDVKDLYILDGAFAGANIKAEK